MIAASPRNPRHIICKRVLGLEGDTVCVPVTSREDARIVKARTPHYYSTFQSCTSCGVLVNVSVRLRFGFLAKQAR